MQVIELDLGARRECLDYENAIDANIEGQAERLQPFLSRWFAYEDVKLVFRAKNSVEYSVVVPRAANGGEAHRHARSLDNFLKQPLRAAIGEGKDLVVRDILGIRSTSDQLAAARARLVNKLRKELKKQHAKTQQAPSRGDKPASEAAEAEADDPEIAELQRRRKALQQQPEGDAEDVDAGDDELDEVRCMQIC